KFFILNKKLHPQDTSSIGIQPPASPSDHPGNMNREKASQDLPTTDSGITEGSPQPEYDLPSVGSQIVSEVPSPRPSSPVIQDGSSENVATGKEYRVEDVKEEENPISLSLMVEKEFVYTLKKRESLRMVGAELGVGWRIIAQENDLDPKQTLEPGQQLVINTRRIIPKTLQEGILINIPDRT